MANFKRKKSRKSIRCSMCTPHRWRGNSGERFKDQGRRPRNDHRREVDFE